MQYANTYVCVSALDGVRFLTDKLISGMGLPNEYLLGSTHEGFLDKMIN